MAMRNLIDPLDFTLDETISILDLADRIASNEEAYSHVAESKKKKNPTATLLTTKSLLLYSMNQAQELVYPLSQQC